MDMAQVTKTPNGNVQIYHNASYHNNHALIIFHGTPLIEEVADIFATLELEDQSKKDRKVYMPNTKYWESTSNYNQLIKEMKEVYNTLKPQLLTAKTIDVAGHSYGPVKALAFLCAIMEDKENGEEILKKVTNLHLYNALVECETNSKLTFSQNMKILFFKFRQFLKSLFQGDFKNIFKGPNVIEYLKELKATGNFKPNILITYNPNDALAPNRTSYMNEVSNKLQNLNIQHKMVNDAKLGDLYSKNNHNTMLKGQSFTYKGQKFNKPEPISDRLIRNHQRFFTETKLNSNLSAAFLQKHQAIIEAANKAMTQTRPKNNKQKLTHQQIIFNAKQAMNNARQLNNGLHV